MKFYSIAIIFSFLFLISSCKENKQEEDTLPDKQILKDITLDIVSASKVKMQANEAIITDNNIYKLTDINTSFINDKYELQLHSETATYSEKEKLVQLNNCKGVFPEKNLKIDVGIINYNSKTNLITGENINIEKDNYHISGNSFIYQDGNLHLKQVKSVFTIETDK